jgi:paraquat-inducible protein B
VADSPQAPILPQAGTRRTRWSTLIWALPVAALMIVAYLAIQWLAERGEIVTVTFARSAGARVGETKVTYQGVEAGTLVDILANKDGHRLDFKLRLRPEAKPGLNTNARFYLIGASPGFDLSSLRAVVSGVSIGYAPGEGGTRTRRFEGLEHAPMVLPGDRGTRYVLTARTLGSVHEGAILLFHGQAIGKVSGVELENDGHFRLDAFIFQPYDALIKAGARFWKVSPLRLSFSGGGLDASLAPVSTLLSGGIELDTAMEKAQSPQSAAESQFTLYASRSAAQQGLSGPTVRYAFEFVGDAGDLADGASVTLLGFQVGEVETVHLAYDEHTGRPMTSVTALLYPQQLDGSSLTAAVTDWRAATDEKIRKLISFGYRARLSQSPPLLGARSIALVQISAAAAAHLTRDGVNPRIPSAAGSASIEDIVSQADQILAKVNRIPIEQIGQHIKILTARLASLAAAPGTADSLGHLHHSLAQLDQMLSQIQPQIGPLVAKLNDAAGEVSGIALAVKQLLDGEGAGQDSSLPEAIRQLNETARSIRTLADYLDRHPEALIRGKRSEK